MAWSCSKCTYYNRDEGRICEICESRKQDNVHSDFANYSLTIRDKEKTDEEKARQIFNDIMILCQALDEPFIDPDFVHNQTSLGNLQKKDTVGGKVFDEPLIWLRPNEIYTKHGGRSIWAVFRDPQPSDVEQGSIGDCWFLAAMALVAERPDILEQIVLTKEFNPTGVYQMRLCVDGKWEIITIDDFFPCRLNSRALTFATGRKSQLWVPLIEKALAKALGSYEKLTAGRTVVGLSILTGASCETIYLNEENVCTDTVWARLLSAKEAGFVMGCHCGGRYGRTIREEYKEKGLVTQHAYSILDVRQEGKYRLVRLRNPWGTFVWNGDWSDNWKGWPAGLRSQLLERHDRGNGTFWMGFADFLTHFYEVDVARVRPGRSWSELRAGVTVGGSFTEEDRSLRIVVESNTEVSMSLFQSGSRTVEDLVDLMVCVHEMSLSGQIGDLVARSPRESESFVTTGEFVLRQGHYLVVCHSLGSVGQRSRKHKGMLVVHSSRPLYCEQLMCPPQMYTDSLTNLLLKEGQTHTVIDGCISRCLKKNFDGFIMMIDNYHEKMYMQLELDCSASQNVTSSRGATKVVDLVAPMHRQIVLLLTHFEPTQSCLVRHRWSIRLVRRPLDPNAVHFPAFENRDMALLHEFKPLFY